MIYRLSLILAMISEIVLSWAIWNYRFWGSDIEKTIYIIMGVGFLVFPIGLLVTSGKRRIFFLIGVIYMIIMTINFTVMSMGYISGKTEAFISSISLVFLSLSIVKTKSLEVGNH